MFIINSVIADYSLLCEALGEISSIAHDDYGRNAGGCLVIFSTFGAQFVFLIFTGTAVNGHQHHCYSMMLLSLLLLLILMSWQY